MLFKYCLNIVLNTSSDFRSSIFVEDTFCGRIVEPVQDFTGTTSNQFFSIPVELLLRGFRSLGDEVEKVDNIPFLCWMFSISSCSSRSRRRNAPNIRFMSSRFSPISSSNLSLSSSRFLATRMVPPMRRSRELIIYICRIIIITYIVMTRCQNIA